MITGERAIATHDPMTRDHHRQFIRAARAIIARTAVGSLPIADGCSQELRITPARPALPVSDIQRQTRAAHRVPDSRDNPPHPLLKKSASAGSWRAAGNRVCTASSASSLSTRTPAKSPLASATSTVHKPSPSAHSERGDIIAARSPRHAQRLRTTRSSHRYPGLAR